MYQWRAALAPMVFGLGYVASLYLLETSGMPDHAKFVRIALAKQAASMATGFAN